MFQPHSRGLTRMRYITTYIAILICMMVCAVAGCGGGANRPAAPALTYTSAGAADSAAIAPEVDAYRVLVYDELALTVLGSPDLSGNVRILPDGTITIPGVGPVYVLGMTIPEVTAKVADALSTIVRYPQVSVGVANFGDRRYFVMGEVYQPGDHAYNHGMTTLAGIAAAGGFTNSAKRSSVMVLRRLGPEKAIAFRLDLREPLKGKNLQNDLPIRPFDIVYVPKTFIASVDVLVDQYFRQLTPPFTLYIDGWNAFHLNQSTVTVLSH